MLPLVSLQSISLSIGPTPLFTDLEVHIGERDRLCLLGRNGTGKSTLMKVISGHVEADKGTRFIKPRVAIARVDQEPDMSGFTTLEDFAASGLPADQSDYLYLLDPLFDDLQLDKTIAVEKASGGEARRAALIKALVSEPDLLLLDEPTNHLDITAITWLEKRLKSFRGAMVLISHDRAFLQALSTASLWLDRGQINRYEGPFSGFEEWQEILLEQEQERLKKLDKKIKEETRWSVEGISARRTRNQGRLRALFKMRDDRRAVIQRSGSVSMDLRSGETSGKRVIEAKNIAKSFGDRVILRDLSLRVLRGDRLGIIGPNGAGKSTLIRLLTGAIEPDSGSIKLGTNLNPLIIDQKRSKLEDTDTVQEVLTGGGGEWIVSGDDKRTHVRSYMKDFLFAPNMARAPVGSLSGGERGRLLIARGFANPTNFMVLDEPTNDLDMDTLDLLVDVLADYNGTLLLVSHDRDFLDRIVTSSLVLEGDGEAAEYPGGYADYKRQLKASQKHTESKAAPHSPEKKSGKTSTQVMGQTLKTLPSSPKLSYKDQRALDMLPVEIETLNDEIKTMETQLADPVFYTKNPSDFSKMTKNLDYKKELLEKKERLWLELEEKRESLAVNG